MDTLEPNTHLAINKELCGTPVEINSTGSKVTMFVSQNMAADGIGLAHGGFVFGLADYAAMLAVNHPNVVLGKADVKFLKPVKVGDKLMAIAEKLPEKGIKKPIKVTVMRETEPVFQGEFICLVTEKHVLEQPGTRNRPTNY